MTPNQLAWLILLSLLVVCFGFVWGYERFQRVASPRQKNIAMVLGIALCGLALLYGFAASQNIRQTTLHEVILPGTSETLPESEVEIRTTEFEVIHPGVIHTVSVVPQYKIGTWAYSRVDFPIELHVQVTDESGHLYVDFTEVARKRYNKLYWDTETLEFVPHKEGRYIVTVHTSTPRIPEIRIRIADPIFTEGRRAEGF